MCKLHIKPIPCISTSTETIKEEEFDELDAKINEMLDSDLPVLFDCVVDKDENCYPMIPSGAAHNEMLFNDDGIDMEVGDEGKVLI